MAKQPQTKRTPELKLDMQERKSRMPLILAIGGAVLGVILLLAVLHMSGWVAGPEEAMYQKLAKGPVTRNLFSGLHHPDFKKSMTTNEALDVSGLRGEMRKAANIIENQKNEIDSLRKKVNSLEKDGGKLSKLEKDVKTLKETGVEVTPEAIMAALEGTPAPGATGSPAAAAAPSALPALPGAQGRSLLSAFQARDYRKVTKIVAAMPADQAADVLDVLSMEDEDFVVEVLASLKEDEAAGILQNFEPGKTGDLLQKIASRRTSGT